ncbi:MAG TPA: hypothetical protein VIJ19_00420 [Opitutaceae bacterium]
MNRRTFEKLALLGALGTVVGAGRAGATKAAPDPKAKGRAKPARDARSRRLNRLPIPTSSPLT